MDIWQVSLAIGALLTLCISWHERRARYWIGLIAFNFLFTAAYQELDLPYPAFVVGMCDAAICLTIYFTGIYRWEMALYRLFQASVLLSIMRFIELIPSNYMYVASLEVVNWLALLVITATTIAQRNNLNGSDIVHNPVRSFHNSLHTLRKKRKKPSFFEAGWG